MDLQRVAAQYLTDENRSVYALLPTGTSPQASTITEGSQDHPIAKVTLDNGLRLLVKEDQIVKRGQKIAEMGSSDADSVQLHFEIRKQGKPVDPARLLPAR